MLFRSGTLQDRFEDAVRGAVGRAVRAVEGTVGMSVGLLEGGQRTARRNAWDAVCADRRRARARAEAGVVLDRLAASGHAAATRG